MDQSFGVRVHLIGIIPSRGSQSMNLLRESDTTTEWDVPTISRFLSVKASAMMPSAAAVVAAATTGGSVGSGILDAAIASTIDTVVAAIAGALDTTEINNLKTYWQAAAGVPQEFDGKLLAQSRATLGRALDISERRYIRAKFTATVQAM